MTPGMGVPARSRAQVTAEGINDGLALAAALEQAAGEDTIVLPDVEGWQSEVDAVTRGNGCPYGPAEQRLIVQQLSLLIAAMLRRVNQRDPR